MEPQVSERSRRFTESVIRDMTRQIIHHHGDNGVNLAQGFPDFPAPQAIKDAACRAIQEDFNQYSITWGTKPLREAIAAKLLRFNGLKVDPEQEITVCCGSTEAMFSSMMALINPGEEIIVFSPYYENYGPDGILAGAVPRFVTLHEPDWHIDPDELRAAFNTKTKIIVVNTPNNPTGKVFTRDELELIAGLCQEFKVIAITDEIYEHLVYDGEHVSLATLPGMRDRTVTINGLSKTYSVTGWRVGWAVAQPALTDSIRKVHDFVTVGSAHPLQAAGAVALNLPDEYYLQLLAAYRERRDFLLKGLTEIGFRCFPPNGAYYIMSEFDAFGRGTDVDFARRLVQEFAVAVVPGSSFYHDPVLGRDKIRFCFAKRLPTLAKGLDLLSRLAVAV